MINVNECIGNFKAAYELFINSCDSMEESELWDVKQYGEMETFYTNDLTSAALQLIAIDGEITETEVEYINATFGFKYTLSDIKKVYESCAESIEEYLDESFENGISIMRKINSKLADMYKELVVMICKIVIYGDRVVTHEEIDEVKDILEKFEIVE